MQALNRIIGRSDPSLQGTNLRDLAKPGSLSQAGFLRALQKRGEKNHSILRRATNQLNEGQREAAVQTEDFHFIDFEAIGVETGEIYMYERISRKLRKIVVEVDPLTNSKVIRQYEFSYKGQPDDFILHLRGSMAKKQEAEFKYKVEVKNKHYEINRANRTLKSLLERITMLENDVHLL